MKQAKKEVAMAAADDNCEDEATEVGMEDDDQPFNEIDQL